MSVFAKTRRKSLFASTFALVGLVCVALVSLDTWRTWQGYENQLADSRNSTDNLARSLAEHAANAIGTVDTVLVGIRSRLESHDITAEQLARLQGSMRAQIAQSKSVRAFFLFAPDGTLMTSSLAGASPSLSIADRDFFAWWQAHRENRPFIGGPYQSKTDGVWLMSVSRRVENPDGTLRAIVVGTIALDVFRDYYRTFDIGSRGVLVLAGLDGTLFVRRPGDADASGTKVIDAATLHSQLAGDAGHFDTVSRIDGVARLGSFRRVPDAPLLVIAALDRSEVLADWRFEAISHAAGVIFMTIAIVLLGLRLTAKIAADGRLTDERLQRSEKMEVIGRLAAGVAHDFNNILQVISGGMEILRDEPALSPQGKAFITEVEGAANRGSSLTHHLLAYSRKQVLSPQLMDVAETLNGLGIVLSRTFRSNIAVTVEVAPGTGMIKVDPNLMHTALMNLAINASQAMPNGGKLRCEAHPAEEADFGELKPGRHVVITVSDTGAGMTPEVLAHAFDPFFTTRGLEGSGLGLPMVQGFSRQSGGDARIVSTPGEGTRVELWLPEAAAAERVTAPQEAARPRSGRVLLVDDSRDVLVMVDAFLRKGGFNVQQAGNGYEALAALATGEKFDLLVTDYMMPGLDGLSLIRQARNFQKHLPALIISGYAETTSTSIDLPDTAFLTKPFQRDRLLAQVGALIGAADKRISETTG